MARESAGSVYVTIDADSSPLLAKYQQAEAQSRAAGQRIAQGLGAGFQQGTGLVDQFGRTVQATVPPLVEATEATEALGVASAHTVTEIQAMSGALRTLDGNGGIRAAERFLATTLGIGGAVQAIFPVIGLLAVAEMLDRVISKFSKAHQQTEEFAAALKSTEQAARGLVNALDDINVDKMRDSFGGAAGERMRAAVLEMQSFDKLTEAAGKRALIQSAGQNENWITKVFGKPTDIAAVKQQIETLSLESQALAAQADEARRHANEVTGPHEAQEAARKAEEERKRQAAELKREQEEAARQARVVIEGIRIAKREQATEEKTLIRENKDELIRGLEEYSREFENDERNRRAAIVAETAARNKANEESIRAGGVRQGSADEIAKLQVEQTYALQLSHTRAEELQYVKDIAASEELALQHKIDALQTLKDYQTQNLLYDEANRTDLEVERAKAALRKQQMEDATRIATARRGTQIGAGLTGIAAGVPGQLGGALASGITGGNIGQQIKQALTGIGKEMMGDVFKELIASILGNSLVTLANSASVELNTFWLAIKSFAGGLFGFAGGGRPPVGVPSIVGENGPELFIPDGAGTIIPNVPASGLSGPVSQLLTASMISNSSTNSLSIGALHLHGVQSVENFARRLPSVLKSRAPNFSPATR